MQMATVIKLERNKGSRAAILWPTCLMAPRPISGASGYPRFCSFVAPVVNSQQRASSLAIRGYQEQQRLGCYSRSWGAATNPL